MVVLWGSRNIFGGVQEMAKAFRPGHILRTFTLCEHSKPPSKHRPSPNASKPTNHPVSAGRMLRLNLTGGKNDANDNRPSSVLGCARTWPTNRAHINTHTTETHTLATQQRREGDAGGWTSRNGARAHDLNTRPMRSRTETKLTQTPYASRGDLEVNPGVLRRYAHHVKLSLPRKYRAENGSVQ